MISRSYIHEYAPHDQFMCESYYLLLEAKDTLNDLVKLENIITEKEYFGESVENELIVLEAEKKNIFTRIGETIIKIFNSFIDILKDTGKSIKDALTGARKKSTDDKFKTAMQNDPKLAQDFIQGVMSGNIKAHDVKDLNKLLDEATKITNDLMKGTIDKKTHGEKIEELLDKFGNAAKNITSILGIVGAVSGVVKGVDYLANRRSDRDRENEKHRREDIKWDRENEKHRREDIKWDRENEKHRREEDGRNEAERRQRRKDRNDQLSGIKNEMDLMDRLTDPNSRMSASTRHEYTQRIQNAIQESSVENIEGYFMTEAASISDFFKKITSFFTDHISFCTDAVKKITDLRDDLVNKTKSSKDSEEGDNTNAAISGIQKVLGVLSKELSTIKNLASKVDKKCEA